MLPCACKTIAGSSTSLSQGTIAVVKLVAPTVISNPLSACSIGCVPQRLLTLLEMGKFRANLPPPMGKKRCMLV